MLVEAKSVSSEATYFLKFSGLSAHDQIDHEPGGVLALVVFWGHGGVDGSCWPWNEVKSLLKPWWMRVAVSGEDEERKTRKKGRRGRGCIRQTIRNERAYPLTMLGVSMAFFAYPLLNIQFVT